MSVNRNEIWDNGDGTSTMVLSTGQHCILDSEDVPKVAGKYWYGVRPNGPGTVVYAAHKPGRVNGVQQNTIMMHRLLLDAPQGFHVHHISGDGLLNTKANLQLVTPYKHRLEHGRGGSEYRGVSRRRDCDRWHAHLKVGTLSVYIGSYLSELEAAKAYDHASRFLRGAEAWINVPSMDVPPEIASRVQAFLDRALERQAA